VDEIRASKTVEKAIVEPVVSKMTELAKENRVERTEVGRNVVYRLKPRSLENIVS
jgi:hypothetical protein